MVLGRFIRGLADMPNLIYMCCAGKRALIHYFNRICGDHNARDSLCRHARISRRRQWYY